MTAASDASIVYVGCTAPARHVLEGLLEAEIPITSVVTIDPEMAGANHVSGYASLRPTAVANDIQVYEPNTYSMDDEAALDHFRTVDPDLIIVNGWQRLLPESILETATYGALGNHGSAFGLPSGRGRSPLNWSLIEDRDRFLLSVIRLDPGADSGDVVTTQKFDITDYDTIETLYYKVAMCLEAMLLAVIDPILAGEDPFKPQFGEPTYYPKRNPEDGEIHWGDGTRAVYNLVRAVAEPYPGAFTTIGDERIMIWEAIPFSADLAITEPAGTIVDVFWTDDFVVATADGTLLVTDWAAEDWSPTPGDRFESPGDPDRVDHPDHHANLTTSTTSTQESTNDA